MLHQVKNASEQRTIKYVLWVFKLKQLITRLLHELDDVDKCKDYQICLRKHYNLI